MPQTAVEMADHDIEIKITVYVKSKIMEVS